MSAEIFDKANSLLAEIEAYDITDAASLEAFRIRFLGSKNVLKGLFAEMRNIDPDRKKEFGLLVNKVKQAAAGRHETMSGSLSSTSSGAVDVPDMSLPAGNRHAGGRHPLTVVQNRMVEIFGRLGFAVVEGPEIDDDWHNFTALNTPEDHPARDMQDTFYVQLEPAMMLRTQTSSAQAHEMEKGELPIRIISPGRVYRNETISARAHCQFHQVEGLYIAENVSFADLKQTLVYFAKEMFHADIKVRLRPSFFPFTEPSAEMDITCLICGGPGCTVCKKTGWVEILGCGMVDPNVLENCGIDSEKYTGFAFGIGVERTAMLYYQVDDLRLFFENDMRFLKQFRSVLQ